MNSLLKILLFEDYYTEEITLIKKTKLKQKKPQQTQPVYQISDSCQISSPDF